MADETHMFTASPGDEILHLQEQEPSKYDFGAKHLLRYKIVLANILKYSVPDFGKFTIEQISDMLVTDSSNPLLVDTKSQESSPSTLAAIRFDLKTEAIMGYNSHVVINLEAQNEIKPKAKTPSGSQEYSLAKRGIYYLARLISEQLGPSDNYYQQLVKCYSIWVILSPKDNTPQVINYTMQSDAPSTPLKLQYDQDADLLELVLIVTDPRNVTSEPIQELLKGLFLGYTEKVPKYIPKSNNYNSIYKEVDDMCDLRDVYREQGVEEGLTKGEAIGIKKGEAIGLTKGIKKAIKLLLELDYEDTFILSKICEMYNISQTEALEYLNAIKAQH